MVPGPKFGTGTKLEAVHTVNGEGQKKLLQRGKKKAEISIALRHCLTDIGSLSHPTSLLNLRLPSTQARSYHIKYIVLKLQS